jgi:hypothetical protein
MIEDDADIEELFETQENYEEAVIPLMGCSYNQDNHAMFDSLKSRLLHGPAWTWIQDFDTKHDGRPAWKALQVHFEDISGQNRLKATAYSSIRCAE